MLANTSHKCWTRKDDNDWKRGNNSADEIKEINLSKNTNYGLSVWGCKSQILNKKIKRFKKCELRFFESHKVIEKQSEEINLSRKHEL